MIIGIPKEMKSNENRVAATPSDVSDLIGRGHELYVEKDAGLGSGFSNEEYEEAGAQIFEDAGDVWKAELILKVKEPLEEEFQYFYEGQILFTFLHLANDRALTDSLMENKVSAIGYETVSVDGKLPLLNPMSEVAGRFSIQAGAQFLEYAHGGSGVLLAGVPGVSRGNVVIIGGGAVGSNAAKMAIGLGANVTILDINQARLAELDEQYGVKINTLMSSPHNIASVVKDADLVVASVLIPGAKAPVLVTEEMVKSMRPGSVVIDVAVDQGGNIETSDRVTTHDDPVYKKHGVNHYAVANMPGAVPRTATIALTNATMPYVQQIANNGLEKAYLGNQAIMRGINVYQGIITNEAVAKAFDLDFQNMYDIMRK